jgi:hypothetical protein
MDSDGLRVRFDVIGRLRVRLIGRMRMFDRSIERFSEVECFG